MVAPTTPCSRRVYARAVINPVVTSAIVVLVLSTAGAQAQTFKQTVSYLITGETDSTAVVVLDQHNCVVKYASPTIETTFFFNAVDLKSIRLVSSSLNLARSRKSPRMLQFNDREPMIRPQ
jgi:hypothetical protein